MQLYLYMVAIDYWPKFFRTTRILTSFAERRTNEEGRIDNHLIFALKGHNRLNK